jgi:hypothetical protein
MNIFNGNCTIKLTTIAIDNLSTAVSTRKSGISTIKTRKKASRQTFNAIFHNKLKYLPANYRMRRKGGENNKKVKIRY